MKTQLCAPLGRPWRNHLVRYGLLVLAIVLLATTLAVSRLAQPGDPADTPGAIKLTAAELAVHYAANAEGADKRFQGRWVQVSGKVLHTGTDPSGRPYAALGEWATTVQCFFGLDEAVPPLRAGQQVEIVGRVSGRPLGLVLIKQCRRGP